MSGPSTPSLHWNALPSIPDSEGFAGSYAGMSNDVLLVAGGANFPGKRPWEGGQKIWHDRIFVLKHEATAWRVAGSLPKPAGYGLSVSTPDGVLLIGGGDAHRHFTAVQRLRWRNEALEFESLPDLPVPLAMQAGSLVGRTVYVAGGLKTPDAMGEAVFLSLDLDHVSAGWRELDYLPGPGRFLATAGSDGKSFYLFGGVRLVPDSQGKSQREWLRDAWRFTPAQGWIRLADLPRAAVAAPSPAAVAQGRLLILGGDDGAQLNTPPADHRGFPGGVLAYNPQGDCWSDAGEVPFSLVTTSAIAGPGFIVIPGGEKRPGIRSTEVWRAELT